MFTIDQEERESSVSQRPMSLEQAMRVKQEFEKRKKRTEQPDLVQYQRGQRLEQQRQESQELSLLERISISLRRAVGITPEREHKKLLQNAQGTYATFERTYGQVMSTLDSRMEELRSANEEASQTEEYARASMTHYADRRDRVDRLEAELDQLLEAGGDRVSVQMYEKQRSLIDARQEKLKLDLETQTAMAEYERSMSRCDMLSTNVAFLQEQAHELGSQLSMLGVLIREQQDQRTLDDTSRGESARSLYERSGQIAQQLRSAATKLSASDSVALDNTYRINIGGKDTLPLVKQWQRIRG